MKRVINNLYTLDGGVAQERVNELRTLLGLGTTGASTEFVEHSLATATNDFLVASGSGVFVKKTLAETKAILFNLGISVTGNTGPTLTAAPTTTGAGLKIHTHLNVNNSGGATYDYTYMNEFKGEYVSTSGVMIGIGGIYQL